nr:RNA-directed DNA polymerase, eukaryota [Tanacetum cinerariifolium]
PVGSVDLKANEHVNDEGDGRQEDVVSPVVNAKVMNILQDVEEEVSCASVKTRGSVLGVLEEVIRLGNKTKKGWIRELSVKHKLNFIAIQETKMESVSYVDVKAIRGNSNFDFVCSDSQGNSGGILCIWEISVFRKDHVTISDSFITIYGTWLPSNSKLLLVSIYAPQQAAYKRVLWEYMSILLGRWNGDAILMGDFNEVRSRDERGGHVLIRIVPGCSIILSLSRGLLILK